MNAHIREKIKQTKKDEKLYRTHRYNKEALPSILGASAFSILQASLLLILISLSIHAVLAQILSIAISSIISYPIYAKIKIHMAASGKAHLEKHKIDREEQYIKQKPQTHSVPKHKISCPRNRVKQIKKDEKIYREHRYKKEAIPIITTSIIFGILQLSIAALLVHSGTSILIASLLSTLIPTVICYPIYAHIKTKMAASGKAHLEKHKLKQQNKDTVITNPIKKINQVKQDEKLYREYRYTKEAIPMTATIGIFAILQFGLITAMSAAGLHVIAASIISTFMASTLSYTFYADIKKHMAATGKAHLEKHKINREGAEYAKTLFPHFSEDINISQNSIKNTTTPYPDREQKQDSPLYTSISDHVSKDHWAQYINSNRTLSQRISK